MKKYIYIAVFFLVSLFCIHGIGVLGTWFTSDLGTDSSNLVLYYDFQNDTNDKSGSGNHGIERSYSFYHSELQGSPTHGTGKYNNGYNLDGSSDYIYLGSSFYNTHRTTLSKDSSYTVSMWFKADTTSLSSNFGLFHSTHASSDRMGISYDGTNVYCTIYGGSYYGNSTALSDTDWHHIAMIKDSSTGDMNCYLDGVKMTGSSIKGCASTGKTVVGSQTDGTDKFDGSIDEVRVWNRTLTTDEISLEKDSEYPVSSEDLVVSYSYENVNSSHALDTNHILDGTYGGVLDVGGPKNGLENIITTDKINMDGYNEVTVSMWINYQSPVRQLNRWFFDNQARYEFGFYSRGSSSNEIRFVVKNDSGTGHIAYISSLDSKISPDEWHLITGTVTVNDNVSIYLDGELEDSIDFPANSIYSVADDEYVFGCEGDGNPCLNMTMDEIRVYNRTLTPSEILELYSCKAPDYGIWNISGECTMTSENYIQSSGELNIESTGKLKMIQSNITVDRIVIADGGKLVKGDYAHYNVV